MKTYLPTLRMNHLKCTFFLLTCSLSFSTNAQKKARKPISVEESRKAQSAYEKRMKPGNDSIYIEFINRPDDKDSVRIFAVNGWYKNPEAASKHHELKNHEFIIPGQQSLERELKISAFTHEMKKPEDFIYPRFYRNVPPGSSANNNESVNGVIDGIYWRDTVLHDFEKERKNWIDSVLKSHEVYRIATMQPFVTDLLQPFYFSKTEITNYQYREFVKSVQDSIARRMVYLSINDDKEAMKYLNISNEQMANFQNVFSTSNRTENLSRYGQNFNQPIDYEDAKLIPLLVDMYYPQPERFYKRREIDVRKLIYIRNNGQPLAIFPDTLSLDDGKEMTYDPMVNMYNWHPAYNDYPVLGLNYLQAEAYCEWYQRKLNHELAKEGLHAEVKIPSLYEYEMAAKFNLEKLGKNQVENLPNDAYHIYKRPLDGEENVFLRKVYANEFYDLDFQPGEGKQSQYYWKYNHWLARNIGTPILFLNGNASEFCSNPLSKEMITYYKLETEPEVDLKDQNLVIGSSYREDVIDLKGNQENAVFYKQVVPKRKSAAAHGFRTVIYLSKIK